MRNSSHTVPSLSGPLEKRTEPTQKPNFAKEPSSPSRSKHGRSDNETNRFEINKGQRTTHGIFHSGRDLDSISGDFEYIYLGIQNFVP